MDVFTQLAEKIISGQEAIIGPLALEQAQKVPGLKINWPKREIIFEGDKTDILEQLIEHYQTLFGKVSVEVCKEAVVGLLPQIPAQQIPQILR